MKKEYYYIDISLKTMAVVGWETTSNATHVGETDAPNVIESF